MPESANLYHVWPICECWGSCFLERCPGCAVMLVSRLGLVPDLDSFSRDADGALSVNFVLCREALGRGLGLRSLVA